MSPSFVRTLDTVVMPIVVIFALILAIAAAAVLGHVILGPLRKAAQRVGRPTQFYLTDFVWLLIQLQLSLGLVSAFVERNPAWAFYTVLGFLGAAFTAMWWGAVRALSQAGVQGMGRRAVLILVLLPGVEATMVATILLAGAAPVVLYRELRGVGSVSPLWSLLGNTAILLLALIGLAVAARLLRLLTLWLLAAAPQADPAGETSA
jgi:hypothetical protein